MENKKIAFKNYRINIIDLLRTNRQCHFQKYFDKSKKFQKLYGKISMK